MATITPGYNFTVNELVTNTKLRTFIENASFKDVNWSEVDPSIPRFGVVQDTAFSMGPEGSIWFDRVNRDIMVMTRWGQVALINPVRMESRRFPTFDTDPLQPGVFVRFDSAGTPDAGVSDSAVEVASGTTTSNMATKVMGVSLYETALSGGVNPRICISGLCKGYYGAWDEIDNLGELFGSASATGQFSREANNTTDRVCAVNLGPSPDQAVGAHDAAISVTGWAFFLPGNVWRK
jgi:hypothetical protein